MLTYQLCEVFDGVDIVVRRRGDEGDSGLALPQGGDVRVDLGPGQLAAFSGLGALGDLDLQLVGRHQIGRGDSETAAGNLTHTHTHTHSHTYKRASELAKLWRWE
jgi:hypothetical protein